MMLLISGLAAIPDSLYRARILQEQTERGGFGKDDDTDKPVVLPWFGWTSDTMLLTDVRNMMDAYLTARSEDRKAQPHPVHAPTYRPAKTLPMHGKVSAADFIRVAQLMGKTGNPMSG